jgi:hypothetical protein
MFEELIGGLEVSPGVWIYFFGIQKEISYLVFSKIFRF